ncbi:helix-turn-helix domain-containing protein [Mesorhizobium sp. M1233]|uniref:helix-turn-helix domain-containing protein n=1 Tax=Mesorhizobium sp. M1233 TaxID=2957072 RepID=UPI003337E8AE
MSDPRFSIIPAGAVLDRRLKARDLQVLCVFGKHIDKKGWCRRSQVTMAKEMGCARSTVQASIERLVLAGWLHKRMLSTPHEAGERDSAHEYRVVLDVPDDTQDVAVPMPTGRHPLPTHGSAPPADPESAPTNVPLLTDPSLTKARAGALWEEEFRLFWDSWDILQRPENRHYAAAIFHKLTAAERATAAAQRAKYFDLMSKRKKQPRMITYLRERVFAELDGCPDFDEVGRFIIHHKRPEWSAWLGVIRSNFGERGVETIVKGGFYKAPSRWPDPKAQAAA